MILIVFAKKFSFFEEIFDKSTQILSKIPKISKNPDFLSNKYKIRILGKINSFLGVLSVLLLTKIRLKPKKLILFAFSSTIPTIKYWINQLIFVSLQNYSIGYGKRERKKGEKEILAKISSLCWVNI